jgi:protein O-mannosyl-transferase
MSPGPARASSVLAAGVFVMALAPFLPGLDGQFLTWDDDLNFLTNPHFRGLGWSNLRWMLTTTLTGHWIPLSWLTLGVNYTLGGMNPWGYHLGNMLLHAGNAVLLYLIARRLLARAGAAAGEPALSAGAVFAALLFAVHPLRVESVVWITERRDVQGAFFFLLSVWGYLYAVAGGRDGRLTPLWRGLSIAAFAAALLSKASTMMLPAALLVLDVYPLRRLARGWRRLLTEKLPYFALAAVDLAVAWMAVQRETKISDLGEYGVAARLTMVLHSVFFYLWKWVWPAGLSPMYEAPAAIDPVTPRFLIASIAVLLVTAALVVLRHRWPAGLAAWTYAALMILPVSGAAHAGYQLAQDRWSYLPESAGPRNNLGAVLVRRSRFDEAAAQFREAMRLAPDRIGGALNLGLLYVIQGKYAEAIPMLRQVLAQRPDRPDARAALATALVKRAEELRREWRPREADGLAGESEALAPDWPSSR